MINLKVLGIAAAVCLVLPLAAPSESLAQNKGAIGGGVAVGGGGGGGGAIGGGGRGVAVGGGAIGGGGGFRGGAPNAAFAGPRVGAGAIGGAPRVAGGGWQGGGGNWQGGGWSGGRRHHHHGGGFVPGLVIGGAIGSSYAYYGGPAYGYYDDGYYDDAAVAVAPDGDADAYCRQTYRSYDPRSGTYLGNDGYRHPCP